MIYPVEIYGSPVLRKVSQDIDSDYEGLSELIEGMFETMYKADGVGLAAPQIGKNIRLIVIDATPMKDENPELVGFKKVVINPKVIERSGEPFKFNEGCLSLPDIREDVERPSKLSLTYYDEDINYHEETLDGVKARILMHEIDHLEGVLFVDRVSPIRKKLLRSKLNAIAKGKVVVSYKIRKPR